MASHWIRIGFALEKCIAETWPALRWVRPVGLLYDATDLGGTRALVRVRLDLTDLKRGCGTQGGLAVMAVAARPGWCAENRRAAFPKTIRPENTH